MADILIVDDTPENLRLLSKMLQDQGYKVRKATNGIMALTAVEALVPDLILLDINMPKMNGYEVCTQLKQDSQTSKIPIIFLSALDSTEDKVKAFQVGGSDYVTKPFQIEEVLARIQHQLTIQDLQKQLQIKNESLEQTLNELKRTQLHLIQQAKTSALGQLVAGIIHEITNPMNFIAGNIHFAYDYVQSLLNLVSIYQKEYPDSPESIKQALEDVDLDFLRSDFPNLRRSMETGVSRIRSLILGLRIFSRLDESELKPVNLHESLDTTIMLLQHRLKFREGKPAIDVIKNYGDLPPVNCYGSQLNQVFLNLLNNAIDALQIKYLENTTQIPTIWISTDLNTSETVKICIKDNGIGISEENLSQIFEPFFTTTNTAQAQGLGLATSYQIVVDKYQGKLTCHSVVGEGTEFILTIPIW